MESRPASSERPATEVYSIQLNEKMYQLASLNNEKMYRLSFLNDLSASVSLKAEFLLSC